MIKPLQAFETAKKINAKNPDNQDAKEFISLFPDAKHFVFTQSDKTLDLGEIPIDHVDLPFPTITISMTGESEICVPKDDLLDQNVYISSILIRETSPLNYEVFYHAYRKTEAGKNSLIIKDKTKVPLIIVQAFMDRLAREEEGLVSVNERIRTRHGGINKITKIKNYVLVCPKKERVEIETKGLKINWSHSWHVRGHWRTVEKIGHDREGNPISNGFTWVKNHVKGVGPLVDKTYVV